MSEPLLTVTDLRLSFAGGHQPMEGLRGVTLSISRGETVALIGESGSGKSLLGAAIAGFWPSTARLAGSIRLEERNLLALDEAEWEAIRGRDIAFAPQSAGLSLNPIRTALFQVEEVFRRVRGLDRRASRRGALELLAEFGLDAAAARLYPHSLSGGMRQRVLIAIGIAAEPRLLIVDEPTKGLDDERRDDAIRLFARLRDRRPQLAILAITHDLALAERLCDRVGVLYAGMLVEDRSAADFFRSPVHPYAEGLLAASPKRGLTPIPGAPPPPGALLPGCPFAPRCRKAQAICAAERPPLRPRRDGNVLCHVAEACP